MRDSKAAFFVALIPVSMLAALTMSGRSGGSAGPSSDGSVFQATPLTDFQPGELYLGKFAGFLYENNSNNPPADHAADGLNFAAKVQPLDSNGRPSPKGKIVVIAIGMSNWTQEWCRDDPQTGPCMPEAFLSQAAASTQVNHTNLVLVDCAFGTYTAASWTSDAQMSYTACKDQRLSPAGVTEKQVQVVLWKDATACPTVSLSSTTVCSATSNVDACQLEFYLGATARYVKTRYPNVQEMFLHSRIYAGYATSSLDPEPYSYESGFAVKWTIEAQILQIRGGSPDPTAGNLSYSVAPWLAWGPYFWASDNTPRSDGLVWLQSDFQSSDYTHPALPADYKVANMILNFYLTSPYSPWFPASGSQKGATAGTP